MSLMHKQTRNYLLCGGNIDKRRILREKAVAT